VQSLIQDLQAAYEGSQWHSFKSAVKGLKPNEALWRPPHYKGFPHMDGSIQNIIFHLGGDSQYQLDHALGTQKLTWNGLTQRLNELGGDLKAALQMADEGYEKLQSALETLTDEDLQQTYATPENDGERTLEDFFRMKIEHHHYHAGQIVYIRNMWRGLKG